jgi:hypothetical protein
MKNAAFTALQVAKEIRRNFDPDGQTTLIKHRSSEEPGKKKSQTGK